MQVWGEMSNSWIAYWISSVHFLVLVNSFATSFFISSRGLRRGDPLSSFLFVIVIVALGTMISAVVSGGLLSNFYVGTKTDISDMLFVYDKGFSMGPTQIIYAIYGAYSYVLKLCWV